MISKGAERDLLANILPGRVGGLARLRKSRVTPSARHESEAAAPGISEADPPAARETVGGRSNRGRSSLIKYGVPGP